MLPRSVCSNPLTLVPQVSPLRVVFRAASRLSYRDGSKRVRLRSEFLKVFNYIKE
uniref:Uncharacterized protein n=1 Tax=Picea glauca TaxID=3330 RepID=A0A101M3Y8_PICGL|nr:hypothetical protein ABT39_MTgene485 [Picea glauca]